MPETHDLILLHTLLDLARQPALAHFRGHRLAVEDKSAPEAVFDPVTLADREIERAMRQYLQQTCPKDGILGEEFGETPSQNQRVWVIDPIDGTRAYISGTPCWGVLVALSIDGEPILGGMDQPFTQERFIGQLSANTELNTGLDTGHWIRGDQKNPLKSRNCQSLDQATLLTTDPRLFPENERQIFDDIEQKCKLSRYGLDCYAYGLIALGSADLVIESGLSAYDIQALIPIVKAAGGVVTNWQGGSAAKGGQVIAAATPELHAEALSLLTKAAL